MQQLDLFEYFDGISFRKAAKAYEAGDYETVLRELTPIAEQGGAVSQYVLGRLYSQGKGVPQNDKVAAEWHERAAENGHADAQVELADMYMSGSGVRQFYFVAAHWYKCAAKQGNPEGQVKLGELYEKGYGVPQDYRTAVKWYTRAANQANYIAQINLGVAYQNGRIVRRNFVKSHMWFDIASITRVQEMLDFVKNYPHEVKTDWETLMTVTLLSQVDTSTMGRNGVSKLMTRSQIAESQELAREFFRKRNADYDMLRKILSDVECKQLSATQ